jgi:prepilin-type processing-associated H-X9-DG protein
MSEITDLLSKQKISQSMSKPEKYECFVDGPAVGMGINPVPCVLNSIAGQTANIVLADGHDTGVEMNVPLSSVAVVGISKMEQAAKDLFRGE